MMVDKMLSTIVVAVPLVFLVMLVGWMRHN
jgi:hypothetical protein